jgi:hypothetical protein
VTKALPPPKVRKGVSLDGGVWEPVDALRERNKMMEVAVSPPNGELDRIEGERRMRASYF